MKLIIKILKGQELEIDVDEHKTTVLELKKEIEKRSQISVAEQKLILVGKNLSDEKSISTYATKDGTKLTLVIKKADNMQTVLFKHFRKNFSEKESNDMTLEVIAYLKNNISTKFSLDDLEKLCWSLNSCTV